MMIGAATFANTTHLTVLNVENPVVKKSLVHAGTNDLQRATSCTVTVTITNSNGSTSSSTATYACETCTATQACTGAYALANNILKG